MHVLGQGHAESRIMAFTFSGNISAAFLDLISKHFGMLLGPVSHDLAGQSIGLIFVGAASFTSIGRQGLYLVLAMMHQFVRQRAQDVHGMPIGHGDLDHVAVVIETPERTIALAPCRIMSQAYAWSLLYLQDPTAFICKTLYVVQGIFGLFVYAFATATTISPTFAARGFLGASIVVIAGIEPTAIDTIRKFALFGTALAALFFLFACFHDGSIAVGFEQSQCFVLIFHFQSHAHGQFFMIRCLTPEASKLLDPDWVGIFCFGA